MKQDLVTSIFTAIVGVIIAYFVCNMILPEIPDFTYKTLSSNPTYNLQNPNPEVFNFRAVNPTVEVYVGQCDYYDINGNCMKETETLEDPNQVNNGSDQTNNSGQSDNNPNGGTENGSTN